jgi:hypothetical protein
MNSVNSPVARDSLSNGSVTRGKLRRHIAAVANSKN